MTETSEIIRPATLDLEVAAALVGIGKNARYKAAKSGQLMDGVPILRVNSTYKVPVAALEQALGIDVSEWLDHSHGDALAHAGYLDRPED